jgi:hypothetical protein
MIDHQASELIETGSAEDRSQAALKRIAKIGNHYVDIKSDPCIIKVY